MPKRDRHGFTEVSVAGPATAGIVTHHKDPNCHMTEEQKDDPSQLLVSGAYKTYSDVCYNNETLRTSFKMSEHLDKEDKPWQYCVKLSDGPNCTGNTIGVDVETLSRSIPRTCG
jgi:hypothetical protein